MKFIDVKKFLKEKEKEEKERKRFKKNKLEEKWGLWEKKIQFSQDKLFNPLLE